VTRGDLSPGVQVAQIAHAAVDFSVLCPDLAERWRTSSNVLVVLSVPDELALGRLCSDVAAAGLSVVGVHEPDLGGSLTAAALDPAAARMVRRLRLAFLHDGEEVRT
jgi:peptidyl-tRNA hydrolase